MFSGFPKLYQYNWQHTLLAKKLCDSRFLGKTLDLIHPHFNMYGFRSYLFFVHYKVVCSLVWCVFWCKSLKEIMSFLSHKCSSNQFVLNCGLRTYFGITIIVPLIRARR